MMPSAARCATPAQQFLSLSLLRVCQAILGATFLLGTVHWIAGHISHRCWNYPLISMPVAGLCVYLSLRSSVAACSGLQCCLHPWLPARRERKGNELQVFLLVVIGLIAMVAVVGALSMNG